MASKKATPFSVVGGTEHSRKNGEDAKTLDTEMRDGNNGGKLRTGNPGKRGPNRLTRMREAAFRALRDPRGGEGREFFVTLKCGKAEDRRLFAKAVMLCLPQLRVDRADHQALRKLRELNSALEGATGHMDADALLREIARIYE